MHDAQATGWGSGTYHPPTSAQSCVMQKYTSLACEPALEPLHIYVERLFAPRPPLFCLGVARHLLPLLKGDPKPCPQPSTLNPRP